MHQRCGRGARDARIEDDGLAAVEAHRDEALAVRDRDRLARERRRLQHRVAAGFEHVGEVDLAATLDPQHACSAVEQDPATVDRRDLHLGVVVDGRHVPSRLDGVLLGRIHSCHDACRGREGEQHARGIDRGHGTRAEVEHRLGIAVERGELPHGHRPHPAVGRDHDAFTGQRQRGVLGRHGHGVVHGRRRGVDDAHARAFAVEHQDGRSLLHDLGRGPACLDDGVQLEHRGVRAPQRLQLAVDDPHRGVAEIHPLRRVTARGHRHAGHHRDDGRHGTQSRERRATTAEPGPHHPTPSLTSTQRSALGAPDLPSRVTVTVAQTRSASSTLVS